MRGALEPARQINSERQPKAIETGTEIGTGSWNADLHWRRVLQLHHGSLSAGLIDRRNHFQRAIAINSGRKRFASGPNGFAEVDELALEWREGAGHGIGGADDVIIRYRRRVTRILFHLPRCQFVAGNNRCALSAVDFD